MGGVSTCVVRCDEYSCRDTDDGKEVIGDRYNM